MKKVNTSIWLGVLCALLLAAQTTNAAEWRQTDGPYGGFVWSLDADGGNIYGLVGGAVHTWHNGSWTRGAATTARSVHAWNGILFAIENNIGIQELLVSHDGGASWEAADLPAAERHQEVVLHTTDDEVYVGFGTTIYRSADASAWTEFGTCEGLGTPIAQMSGDASTLFVQHAFAQSVCRFNTDGMSLDPVQLPAGFGFMSSLVLHNDEILTFSTSLGVARSRDGGESWDEINTGLVKTPGGAFPTLYSPVALGGKLFMADNLGQIWRFDNDVWTVVSSQPGIYDLVASDGELVIGTQQGVFSSDDEGETWTSLNKGLLYQNVQVLHNVDGILIANTNGTTVRSLDGGSSWETVHPYPIAGLARNGSTLFARMEPRDPNGVLYRSDDLGASWELLNNEFDSPLLDLSDIAHDGENLYVTFNGWFVIHGRGTSRWGFGGVRRSSDDGLTWERVNAGLPFDVNVPVPTPQIQVVEDGLLIATADGLFRSGNGGNSWQRVNAGLPPDARNISITAVGNDVHATVTVVNGTDIQSNVYKSENGGRAWSPFGMGLPQTDAESRFSASSIDVVDGVPYLHSYWFDAYHLFRHDGNQWNDVTAELPDGLTLRKIVGRNGQLYAGAASAGVWTNQPEVSTSVDESSNDAIASPAAYPNPFSTQFTIEHTSLSGTVTVKLFDVAGVEVLNTTTRVDAQGILHITVPADLAPGVYVYRVTGATGELSGALVRS